MKITISREAMLSLITPLMPVVSRGSSKGDAIALGTIRFSASKDGKVAAAVTDLVTMVENTASATVHQMGEACIPARKLFDIVRALGDGAQIDISVDGGYAAWVQTGRSRFKLSTVSPSDFPVPTGSVAEEGQKAVLELSQKDLADALARCSYAMGKDDARKFLNGLLFDVAEDHTNLMATDGHRLALSKLQLSSKTPIKAIVPNAAVQYLATKMTKGDHPVRIAFSDCHCRIEQGSLIYQTQLLSGNSPDYRAVIPDEGSSVTTSRTEFIGALERAKIVVSEKTHAVRIHFEHGQVGVSATNQEQEDSRENLDANTDLDGMDIGFNVNYLLDALRSIDDDDVVVGVRNNNASVLIRGSKPNQHLNVVMPVRL